MKKLAMIVVLAISGFALSSEFTPASASKMNGKCCQSSDGGRSNRHQMAMHRAAMPHTCSAYAAACMHAPSHRAGGWVPDVPGRASAMPADRRLHRPLQRLAVRRNAENVAL
jgi:hypothetical protein